MQTFRQSDALVRSAKRQNSQMLLGIMLLLVLRVAHGWFTDRPWVWWTLLAIVVAGALAVIYLHRTRRNTIKLGELVFKETQLKYSAQPYRQFPYAEIVSLDYEVANDKLAAITVGASATVNAPSIRLEHFEDLEAIRDTLLQKASASVAITTRTQAKRRWLRRLVLVVLALYSLLLIPLALGFTVIDIHMPLFWILLSLYWAETSSGQPGTKQARQIGMAFVGIAILFFGFIIFVIVSTTQPWMAPCGAFVRRAHHCERKIVDVDDFLLLNDNQTLMFFDTDRHAVVQTGIQGGAALRRMPIFSTRSNNHVVETEFAPDGSKLLLHMRDFARLIDVETGEVDQSIENSYADFSADGNYLALTTYNSESESYTLRVGDLTAETVVLERASGPNQGMAAAEPVLIYADKTEGTWTVYSLTELEDISAWPLPVADQHLHRIQLSPDATLAVMQFEHVMIVADVATGETVYEHQLDAELQETFWLSGVQSLLTLDNQHVVFALNRRRSTVDKQAGNYIMAAAIPAG